jgi:hypothetical protein
MSAAEEGAPPLMYQVIRSSYIFLISRYMQDISSLFLLLFALAFLLKDSYELSMVWVCYFFSDCGPESQHPL